MFHADPTIQTAFIYVFFPPEERGIEKEEGYKSFQKATLEVLSSEMDQAHSIGLETPRRFFRKIRPSTIEREPFEA